MKTIRFILAFIAISFCGLSQIVFPSNGGSGVAGATNWVDSSGTNSLLAGIAKPWGLIVTNVGATKLMGTDANGATTNVILSGASYSGNTLTITAGGTPVGTVVNSGASIANAQFPTYTDTTGTNVSPVNVTNGLTIQGSKLYATNIQANQLGFSIGSAAGNVVNTGASTANAIPIYSDTTGTNITPSNITTSGLTNLFSGTMTATNVGASKLAGTDAAGMFTNIVVGFGLTLSSGTLSASGGGGGSSLDSITADAASSSINNGAFTNQWYWTDPGASKKSFAIKGTNSTASTTISLSGQMTSATAKFLDVTETTASTGGANSQYLANFATIASSTANPLRVAVRGTEAFRVDQTNPEILANDGSLSAAAYGFASRPGSGMIYSGGPYIFYDSSFNLNITSSAMVGNAGASFTMNNRGFNATDGGQNGNVLTTGSSAHPGLGFISKVNVSSSGTVSLTSGAEQNDSSLGSGTIQVATGAVTYTTPSSPTIGDTYTIYVNTGSTVTINVAANSATQQLRIGSSITTANTGHATCSTQGSWIRMIYVSSNLWVSEFSANWSTT